MTYVKLLALLPLLFAGLGVRVGFAEPAEIRVHVSPQGDDAGNGSALHPFRTLEHARDVLRALRAEPGRADASATVVLLPGRYARSKTLRLEAQDGGRPGTPVRWVTGGAAGVVVHGGIDLPQSAFQRVTDDAVLSRLPTDGARAAVHVADLGAAGVEHLAPIEARGFGQPIRPAPAELFVDGEPQTLARWPNEGFVLTGKVLDPGSRPRDDEKPDRGARFHYDGDRPARWQDAQDVWLYGYWFHDWADESLPLATIDPQARVIGLGAPHRYGVREGKAWFAENLLEELDRPGEYTIDRAQRRLYIWTAAGWEDATVVLSRLGEPLVHIVEASHILLEGIGFETTRGDAIVVEGGTAVHLASCGIRNTGARGVVVRGGTRHEISRCRIHGTGEGGVHLEGGERARLVPAEHVVRDSDIYDFSRRTSTYRPAVRLLGVGHRVEHNELHDAPHAAVIFTGNDHRITGNHIHHVLTRTGDGGAVYCGRDWTLGGTVIRHNWFHDLRGIGKWENAIYLDDQASGIEVVGNRIERCHLGMLIGGGRRNRIEGNLIVDCETALRFGHRGLGWAARMRPTLEERLAAVPYREEPWRSRFPWLSTLLQDEPMAPRHNVVRANVLIGSGRIDTHLSKHVVEHGEVKDNPSFTEPPGELAADGELPPGFAPVNPPDAGPRGE